MGLVGRTRRCQTRLSTNLHLLSSRRLSIKLRLESPQSEWPLGKTFTLRLRILNLLNGRHSPTIRPQLPLSGLLNLIFPPHLTPPLNRQIRPPNLLHSPRPLPNSQVPHALHILRLNLDNSLSTLHHQHLLLRLRLPRPKPILHFRRK
jgi:hypothetical protein